MDDMPSRIPDSLPALRAGARRAGFTLSCEERTGSLPALLAATRPAGRILELGTGVGEGTAWLLGGMDRASRLVTVERLLTGIEERADFRTVRMDWANDSGPQVVIPPVR
ncbi:hypothetical protein [Streptomyces sp. NPDC048357]|uniref:hypothetical protein n=1 Tax=Streptomyces sp. NPDC048357 TaxID=3154719 RepID=UPI0034337EF4